MESDNAYFATWGGKWSNTTKNHYELHKFSQRDEKSSTIRIKFNPSNIFLAVIAEYLIRLEA
jgi:hypothetical protein